VTGNFTDLWSGPDTPFMTWTPSF